MSSMFGMVYDVDTKPDSFAESLLIDQTLRTAAGATSTPLISDDDFKQVGSFGGLLLIKRLDLDVYFRK